MDIYVWLLESDSLVLALMLLILDVDFIDTAMLLDVSVDVYTLFWVLLVGELSRVIGSRWGSDLVYGYLLSCVFKSLVSVSASILVISTETFYCHWLDSFYLVELGDIRLFFWFFLYIKSKNAHKTKKVWIGLGTSITLKYLGKVLSGNVTKICSIKNWCDFIWKFNLWIEQ